MKYIHSILEEMYDKMENKEMFLPLIIANGIVCHRLAYYDKSYWMAFAFNSRDPNIKMDDIHDIFNFFEIFLMDSIQFEYAYHGRMNRLEDFRIFLEEFFFKQKYFFKHPDDFRDKLKKAI